MLYSSHFFYARRIAHKGRVIGYASAVLASVSGMGESTASTGWVLACLYAKSIYKLTLKSLMLQSIGKLPG